VKLFGKDTAPRRDVIFGHCYDDELLDAAKAEAREGHLRASMTVLNECRADPELRCLRADVLGECLFGFGDQIAKLGKDHRDPDLLLLAGKAHTTEAWGIRGTGDAVDLSMTRMLRFQTTLREALEPLQLAAELLPDDAAPWVALMAVARGLGMSRAEQDTLWAEVNRRAPDLYAGHMARMQVVAAKWYGSHEEMTQFAADTVDSVPEGNPLTAILPAAYFELHMAEVADLRPRRKKPNLWRMAERTFQKPAKDIADASRKWLQHEQAHPYALDAHNLFAGACGLAGDRDRALVHLLHMEDRLAASPWALLDEDAAEAYQRLVARVGGLR
jgi:hypothetical protein